MPPWRTSSRGQAEGVDNAYKCNIRKPLWWRVPLVKPADLLLTYMNADAPRLCQNLKQAHHLNSVHGVYLKPEYKELGARLLPLASLSSATLLGSELVGRAYGGGMLKLEPREADGLPVPSPVVLQAADAALEQVRSKVQKLTRAGRLLDASGIIDDVLLVRQLTMSREDVDALRREHRKYLHTPGPGQGLSDDVLREFEALIDEAETPRLQLEQELDQAKRIAKKTSAPAGDPGVKAATGGACRHLALDPQRRG